MTSEQAVPSFSSVHCSRITTVAHISNSGSPFHASLLAIKLYNN